MRTSPLRHPARLAGASLLRLQSDERLAELAIDGHEAAFDAIVVRYRSAIQRYCAGIVGAGRAEDATQQTLINAHDALKRTDEVRHLRSWLYRIAHNASLNVLRSVRDDVPLDELTARDALGRADDGPAQSFERSERFRATVAALQELPEHQRAALVLRELEGRSHEEIAEALGVTKGSARQHLMRARVAVRGAVTAITPYPLLVRLADGLGGNGGDGWTEAVAGAGAGATLTKLTAGVVATGALVGGAVGTNHVIFRGGSEATRAAEVRGGTQPAANAAAAGPSAAAARNVLTPDQAGRAVGGSTASRSAAREQAERRQGAAGTDKQGRDGGHAGATAPAASGSDDGSSGTSGRGRGHGAQGKANAEGKSKGKRKSRGKGHKNRRSKGSGPNATSGSGRGGTGKSGSGPAQEDEPATSGSDDAAETTAPAPAAGTVPEGSSGPTLATGTPGEPAASGTTTTGSGDTSKNRSSDDGDSDQ